jgi:minor histocompatibility antigen H13
MAEPVIEEVVQQATAELNASAAINGTIGRQPSSPEGMAFAYGSLVLMALIPIFIGSHRSVGHHKEQKVTALILQ